jgi:AmmeMemoRadiSam system protein B
VQSKGICRSRVFLLGPSHHYNTRKCALSTASIYKTPLGDLPIDLEGSELQLTLITLD